MKSTWYEKDPSQHSWQEKMLLGIQPHNVPQPKARKGKLPVMPTWRVHAMLAPKVALACLPEFVCAWYGYRWHPLGALVFYGACHSIIVRTAVKAIMVFVQKWGFFDGEVARDKIPDYKVKHIAVSAPGEGIKRRALTTTCVHSWPC